jgi:hypothetical protein
MRTLAKVFYYLSRPQSLYKNSGGRASMSWLDKENTGLVWIGNSWSHITHDVFSVLMASQVSTFLKITKALNKNAHHLPRILGRGTARSKRPWNNFASHYSYYTWIKFVSLESEEEREARRFAACSISSLRNSDSRETELIQVYIAIWMRKIYRNMKVVVLLYPWHQEFQTGHVIFIKIIHVKIDASTANLHAIQKKNASF